MTKKSVYYIVMSGQFADSVNHKNFCKLLLINGLIEMIKGYFACGAEGDFFGIRSYKANRRRQASIVAVLHLQPLQPLVQSEHTEQYSKVPMS